MKNDQTLTFSAPAAIKSGIPSGRRTLLAAAALLSLGGPALAQNDPAAGFPSHPVTVITAFAVGSGPDAVLRIVGEKLAARWKQSVTVDNRPGGGGFVAIEAARRAKPDGYTLLQLDSEHVSALPYLYKKRNFVPLEHFDPVAPLFLTPFFVAVPTNSPWKNMGDLIKAAKAEPGKVSYGSWGVGSPGHLGGEWLDYLTGSKMTHVPYREVSQLFTSVANGDPAWSFASLPSSQGIYKSGKIRYIAVAAPKRIAQMPDVPTVAEAGYPDFEVVSWFGLAAPAATPKEIVARLNAEVGAIARQPGVKESLAAQGLEPWTTTPEQFAQRIKADYAKYGQVVKASGATFD